MQSPQPQPPKHNVLQVTAAIFVFYAVIVLFDAKGIYNWTRKLPVSETTRTMRALADKHWERTARWGLEEPKFTLETLWLDAQEAHPLLYPRKYADIQARKKAKALAAANPDLPKKPLEKEVFDPDELVDEKANPKVLVLGDSIMMTVGPVIKKDVVDRLHGGAVVKAKLATGLARPDVFDWTKELKRLTTHRRFDYVVMMLGTNDSQDFVENGEILTYGTQGWVKAYNHRLDALMTAACEGADEAVWIGLPPMQGQAFNRKAVRINSWAMKQAEKHPCVKYLSVDRVIGDDKGNYTSYRKLDGRLEKIRMVDGIHVTARGGTLISSRLLELLQAGGKMALSH